MAAVALVEVLGRDGGVRQSVPVNTWPLRVGRALDNDLVLDDPHTAPYHFSVEANEVGVAMVVGETVNGVQSGTRWLSSGSSYPVGAEPLHLMAGRTHLRLRLASHPLLPELALAASRTFKSSMVRVLILGVLAAGLLMFNTYLDIDPDGLVRALGSAALSMVGVVLTWCGLWTLLSKVFTHQGHFAWHVSVVFLAAITWQVVNAACKLLAFSLSWKEVTDFSFILGYAIVGAMLYFHLLAVEPHRPRRVRSITVVGVVVGIGLSLWFNWQASDRLGDELYMNHFFPPSFRLVEPVDTATFMEGIVPLQALLDEAARKNAEAD